MANVITGLLLSRVFNPPVSSKLCYCNLLSIQQRAYWNVKHLNENNGILHFYYTVIKQIFAIIFRIDVKKTSFKHF